ncbi:hypothetical protein ACFFU9_15440 [Mariniflexile ostreae]|uniref:Uncharacterized protein n=1 Tax=Mariniflexile ostreae TaxID=1520892 RepID=A0ABV5FFA0_9FLAO
MSKSVALLHLARLEKLERKRKNLIRLGIEAGQAYAWSRTRKGGWAVAQLRSTSRNPNFKYNLE